MNDETRMPGSLAEEADLQYNKLRAEGHGGWGGDQFDQRRVGWETTLRTLMENQLLPAAPARILELGCGNGMISLILANQGYSVVGVDISRS
ncbi:methyltransferase domain-containing protein, partial [Stenotrophomonas maltophilia group sp. RNC7]|uniref:class I SAM-dependent methyltransferase n=1 Tax=Stenotrophomonas maltophilia group sp. RNC7 TaxID=3071467 RepID=UPI0027DF16A2